MMVDEKLWVTDATYVWENPEKRLFQKIIESEGVIPSGNEIERQRGRILDFR